LTFLAGMLALTFPPEMHRVEEILYARRWDGTVALLEIVQVNIVARCRRTRSVTTKLAGTLAQTWLPGTHHVKAILHVHKQAGKTVPLEIVQVYIVAPCR